MSRTCGITIIVQPVEQRHLELLLLLINHGWSATHTGHIGYRPLGDVDDFDWHWFPAQDWPSVLKILEQKQVVGEVLALDLTWGLTGMGGFFWVQADEFYPNGVQINTLWRPDRPLLDHNGWITDHGWFLQRILPALRTANIFVASVECRDVY